MNFNFDNWHWSRRFALAFVAVFVLSLILFFRTPPESMASLDFIDGVNIPIIESSGFIIGFFVILIFALGAEIFVFGTHFKSGR